MCFDILLLFSKEHIKATATFYYFHFLHFVFAIYVHLMLALRPDTFMANFSILFEDVGHPSNLTNWASWHTSCLGPNFLLGPK